MPTTANAACLAAGGDERGAHHDAGKSERAAARKALFEYRSSKCDGHEQRQLVHLHDHAHLARLEGHTVLREVVNHVDSIEILGQPQWRTNPTLRGLAKLDVRLTGRTTSLVDAPA